MAACAACQSEEALYCLHCAVADRLERIASVVAAGFAASCLDVPRREGAPAWAPPTLVQMSITLADALIDALDKRRARRN